MNSTKKILIWDLPVRLFHWLTALAVLGSWTTHKIGSKAFTWHQYFGYTVLVLVAFRLLWGFVGPRHARFASFLRGPVAAWRYARALPGKDWTSYPGHNPLGGWMTVVLLLLLAAQGVSGLFANDEIADTGPLYGYVTDATSDKLTGWHETLSQALWVAIGVHLAAVLSYLLFKRDNLIVPMLTGRKGAQTPAQEGIPDSRLILALVLAAACAALLVWVVRSAPVASLGDFF